MLLVHRDDVDVFIPKTVMQFRDVKKSGWSQMIAAKLETCRHLSPFECQVQFLGTSQPVCLSVTLLSSVVERVDTPL